MSVLTTDASSQIAKNEQEDLGLQLGSLHIKTKFLLAPIARYCDLPFRRLVRELGGPHGGAGLACTDLLCPQAVLGENEKSLWLAATHETDRPVCMQLYGRDPAIMAQAAQWAEAHGASTIDINMGCPVDKVTKKNGGSMLLCEPCLATDIVSSVKKAVKLPVTAKIRLGWDEDQLITKTLPIQLADQGACAITVHGRTTVQKFRGHANLNGITDVVESVKRHHPDVKVIGNGDVKTCEDAARMFNVTGCDGIMVGRGALGQPWIFAALATFYATGQTPPPPSRLYMTKVVMRHLDLLLEHREEKYAMMKMKQRMSWYSPFLQPWPHLRRNVQNSKGVSELRDLLQGQIDRLSTQEDADGTLSKV